MAQTQDNVAPSPAQTEATAEHAKPAGSVLDDIINQTSAIKTEKSKPLVKKGIRALLRQILATNKVAEDDKKLEVNRAAVDQAIAKLDEQLGKQLDLILHHERFQQLESGWRGLKTLVERTDFRQNIGISVLNVSKQDLQSDFADANEIFQSGLYYHVHKAEYGQFGGKPYGAIIANYDFGPSAPDIKLLRFVAGVAAMAHAPFVAAAKPEFFGLENNFTGLPRKKDVRGMFEGVQYIDWKSFRDSEDARYVGLTAPRFLLRLPYDPKNNPIKSFNYKEKTDDHGEFLWGNTAFAFATRLTESFAKYRWCPNIIGPQGGGTIEQLPVHLFTSVEGDLVQKIPTEVLIPEVLEYELSEEGFIALTMRKDSDNACFFSANSVRKPRKFPNTPEGQRAETNERLGMQLPYLLVVSRLAHYIKVLQREALGTDKEKKDLQNDLETWIKQYVTDDDNPQPGIRAKRPLRSAVINVEDVAGRPGWYAVSIKVRPHFKFMGASFELSLVGQQGPPGK